MNERKIKPIDTEYKGYLFRSRLEARYAVFFDELGWEWGYEKEGYELKSGRYLPDFWFPDIECFAEIKPEGIILNRDIERIVELSYNFPVILFEGTPGLKSYLYFYEGHQTECIPVEYRNKFYPLFWSDHFNEEYFEETVRAVKVAKQKRFEFLNK